MVYRGLNGFKRFKDINYLLNKYPALEEYKHDDRFNLKKNKEILENIDTDEDKDKFISRLRVDRHSGCC